MPNQLASPFRGRTQVAGMPSSAASSATRGSGSHLVVTPGFDSHDLVLPPAAATASAKPMTAAASGDATFTRWAGRSGGGAGMSSPSSARARARAAAPSFRTPAVDIAQNAPFSSMGTMKTSAAMVSGKLTRAWPISAQARLVKGASITCRGGDAAGSVMRRLSYVMTVL